MILLNFIRSLVFTVFFYLNTILLMILVIAGKILRSKKIIKKSSKNWTKITITLIKYICGVKYKIIGSENIPNDNFIIVSKHQSTWETYFLFQYFNQIVCIAKKELTKIPLIGHALTTVGCIAVDRKDNLNTMKNILEQSKYFIQKERRNLLIFPQGTRVSNDEEIKKHPYKSGFIGIVKENKVDILPIALNSGKCWPRGSLIKKPGLITVSILPIIKYEVIKNLNKNEILKIIENVIETEQKKINE